MNKKFALLLVLMLALVMGSVTSASAAQIKATGKWTIEADLSAGNDFQKKGAVSEDKTFNIAQRVRTAFEFIANENLKGVLDTQIGTANWGTGAMQVGAGRSISTAAYTLGAAQAGNGNIMLRRGYVDFKWPNTKVNFLVGYQTLSLPSAVGGGSPVLDDQLAAAAAVVPITDGLSLVGGFGRLFEVNPSQTTTSGANTGSGTAGDVAFLIANVDMIKGVSLKPWLAYANLGAKTAATTLAGFQGANSSSISGVRAYWGGAALTVSAFDPFKIMADFNYGKATWNNNSNTHNDGGRQGFLFDAAIDYTGLSMMTPELFFAYSSGESGNSTNGGKSDRMPVVGSPQTYALGSFWLQGGDSLNSGQMNTPDAVMGYWALGLSFKDIKLIDKLSHTVHFIYFKGTNDVDYLKQKTLTGTQGTNAAYGKFLTTKDSLFEVDVNSKYQIYDELSVGLELGYISANFNKNAWGAVNSDYQNYGNQDAYKAGLIVNYNF